MTNIASTDRKGLSVVRLVIGVGLCVVGAVWFGQGIGVVGGSFMTGQAIWAIFGGIAVVFGVLLLRGLSRRS